MHWPHMVLSAAACRPFEPWCKSACCDRCTTDDAAAASSAFVFASSARKKHFTVLALAPHRCFRFPSVFQGELGWSCKTGFGRHVLSLCSRLATPLCTWCGALAAGALFHVAIPSANLSAADFFSLSHPPLGALGTRTTGGQDTKWKAIPPPSESQIKQSGSEDSIDLIFIRHGT